MDLISQNETDPEAIAAAIATFVKLGPEAYSGVSRQGVTIDLSDSVPFAQRVIGLFARIKPEDIDILTEQSRQSLSNQIRSIQQLLRNIEHAAPHTIRPQEVANEWRMRFQTTARELARILPIPYTSSERSDQKTKQALQKVQADSRQIAEAKDQMEQMLEDARSDLAEIGAGAHAGLFKRVSEGYRRAKVNWLQASAFIAAVTAFAGWWFFTTGSPPDDPATAISFAASRVFVLGVLSYALVWSSRIYRASAHNQIVNEHRYNALTTFREFVNAAPDEATKNVVLVQATQCIFSHRPSGFGQNEDDAGSSSHVLELTRNVISGEKA